MHDFRYLVILLEGAAAIAGLYYYKNNPLDKPAGVFSYFLLFTYFIESIGLIPAMIYWNEPMHFLKTTFLNKNYWLYNPYLIISFVVYLSYFNMNIQNGRVANFFKKIIGAYALASVLYLIFSDVFFETMSTFTYVAGSILLLSIISYYYYEILVSNRLLNITREISFYISIAAVVYFLTTTPIFIYFKYFTNSSPEFIKLSTATMIIMNIFMYSTYIIGFLSLSKKKQALESAN